MHVIQPGFVSSVKSAEADLCITAILCCSTRSPAAPAIDSGDGQRQRSMPRLRRYSSPMAEPRPFTALLTGGTCCAAAIAQRSSSHLRCLADREPPCWCFYLKAGILLAVPSLSMWLHVLAYCRHGPQLLCGEDAPASVRVIRVLHS